MDILEPAAIGLGADFTAGPIKKINPVLKTLTKEGVPGESANNPGLSKDGRAFSEILARVRTAKTEIRPKEKKAPYSYLAENGIINYKGVVFVCDDERQQISLGDVSDPEKCISIPLEGGGRLVVNRENLGDLAKAIEMFSPEDVNRIMRAISIDAKCQAKLNEIEEEKSGIKSERLEHNEEQ